MAAAVVVAATMMPTTRRRMLAYSSSTLFRRIQHDHNTTTTRIIRNRRRHYYHTTSILCTNTTTTNKNNLHHDHDDHADKAFHNSPQTNGGTILGTWIFHRHGDRAPNRYLGHPTYLPTESDHWYSRIPPPPGGADTSVSGSTYEHLSKYFVPEIHASQNGGTFLDISREPFGFLTYRGMDQMRNVGRKFRCRYERLGRRRRHRNGVSNNNSSSNSSSSSNSAAFTATDTNDNHNGQSTSTSASADIQQSYSFLDHWHVQAYSTNYLRTVMSVQCFLDGLIGSSNSKDHSHSNNTTKNDKQHRRVFFAGGGLKRYYRDAGKYERLTHDGSTWTTPEDMRRTTTTATSTAATSNDATATINGLGDEQHSNVIKVQVRNKEIDTLNAFDRFPERMNGLVKDVIATEEFQRIDGAAKPLADILTTYLPGLRGAPQAFGGTPSGINWIHANDHFVCRKAHDVPLLAFSEYETNTNGGHGHPRSTRSHAPRLSGQEKEDAAKGGKDKERKDHPEATPTITAEQKLASLANPVCAHLAWRFREWYRCPKLLSAIACPPLREVMEHMARSTSTSMSTPPTTQSYTSGNINDDSSHATTNILDSQQERQRQPLVLYSCHDVTLLALLYAIGADFLVLGEDCGGANMDINSMEDALDTHSGMSDGGLLLPLRGNGAEEEKDGSSQGHHTTTKSWRWWPAYSSTIAFELVLLEEEDYTHDTCEMLQQQHKQQYVIRVILNGTPVRLVPRMSIDDEGLLEEQSVSSRQVFGEVTENEEEGCSQSSHISWKEGGLDHNHGMMTLEDFEQVIRVLEEAGGSVEDDSKSNNDVLGREFSTAYGGMDKIGVDGG